MIFVDSNIPMYLVGSADAERLRARRLLERLVTEERRLVTDAEVLQEILHRYAAIRCLKAVQPAFEALLGVVDAVFPVELADVQRAKEILLGFEGLSARDAIHAATMERNGIEEIVTFDVGFDRLPRVRRIRD